MDNKVKNKECISCVDYISIYDTYKHKRFKKCVNVVGCRLLGDKPERKKRKPEVFLNATRFAKPISGNKNGSMVIAFTEREIKRILNTRSSNEQKDIE